MKTTEVHDMLAGIVNSVSMRKGEFTVRRGFFYRHGMDSQKLADRVKATIPNAMITDHGEKWTSFRGGAELRNSSHFWVKFTIAEAVVATPVAA